MFWQERFHPAKEKQFDSPMWSQTCPGPSRTNCLERLQGGVSAADEEQLDDMKEPAPVEAALYDSMIIENMIGQ